MATLTLVLQGREVRKFALNAATTTIGRAQDNDIVINNLALSRHHAEVHRRQGRFELQDRGSQNGVFVNEERISRPRVLRDGDHITLGTYRFIFSEEAEAIGPGPRTGGPRGQAPLRSGPLSGGARVPQARVPTEISEVTPRPKLTPPAPDTRRIPLLVLRYNDVEAQRFPLESAQVVVGRSRECDIQIAERRLSRRHCELKKNDADRVFVRDLGSQNGTFVNRRRVDDIQELQHGDVLNFAEYSILFLSDVDAYDGPDRPESRNKVPVPRPRTGIEKEETEFPAAYDEAEPPPHRVEVMVPPSAGGSSAEGAEVVPRDGPDDPRRRERSPLVDVPKRAKVRQQRLDAPSEAWSRRRREPPPTPLGAPPPPADPRETADLDDPAVDVDDPAAEPRPEAALDDWYGERELDEDDEEVSALLERSPSRVSRVLSTMMIDKRELDRHLARKTKRRRYKAHVTARGEVIYSGPLENEVTILGKDQESDILLVGRYVAGRHSLLVQVRDSLLLVRLGSSSAARVNGLPKLQAFLRDGDVVQIDETSIEITEL